MTNMSHDKKEYNGRSPEASQPYIGEEILYIDLCKIHAGDVGLNKLS